jgi:UDP-glucose 4-epimerase
MRALVTGHLGYIGGNFVKKWEELGHTWVGYDYAENHAFDLTHGIKGLHVNHEVNPIDVIVHFAAIPRVAFSVEHPRLVMSNNINSTSVVLDWARKKKIPVIYSSSSSVVGNGADPTNPYALSKYVGELETLLYNELYGLKTVALRYFNVYSYDQEANSEYATVVCNWKKFITEGRVPYITGDGEQRRDMTHVDDIVSANIFCAENIDKEDLWGHWYDIGSGENISLNELKEIVLQYFPNQVFNYVDPRIGDVLLTKADLSKFAAHGWKSKIPLEPGLNSIYETLKEELSI